MIWAATCRPRSSPPEACSAGSAPRASSPLSSPCCGELLAVRAGGPHGAGGQHLPLHRLQPDPRCGRRHNLPEGRTMAVIGKRVARRTAREGQRRGGLRGRPRRARHDLGVRCCARRVSRGGSPGSRPHRRVAMPGVRAVATAADAPDNYAGWVLRDQRLFASDRVRYEGQPIAAVAADSPRPGPGRRRGHRARHRAASPPSVDLDEALGPDAPLVHPDWESFVPTAGPDYPRGGNLAAESVSDPPGGRRGIRPRGPGGQRRIRRPAPVPGLHRAEERRRDLPRRAVHGAHRAPVPLQRARPRVPVPRRPALGGSRRRAHHRRRVGAKLDAGLEPYAALLSKAARGLAVKLVNTRTEDLLTCPSREGAVTRLRSALDADGNIISAGAGGGDRR